MKTNYSTIYIIIFILLIILLIFLIYYYNKKYLEEFKNEKDEGSIIKSNMEMSREMNLNNLIKNGSFENGQNCKNQINQSGMNKILVKKNPGKSSYVLYQKNTNTLTYYELQCDNDKNNKYNLYFWLCIGDKSIEELDFNKLVTIKFQNEDFSSYIPRINHNIIQKIVITNNEDSKWYLVKYDFISGPNTKDKMNIYLNYSEKLQYPEYYFTDIALYKVLIDAENFIYNNKLICYVDGYNYQANIPTWHDLSGNGNDLFWSNIPDSDLTIGSLSTLYQKLTGFPSNYISENFSILFCLNKKIENDISDVKVDEKNSITDFYLISIPGNNRYAFEIKIKDDYLYLIEGKNETKTENKIIIFNKSLLAITSDGDEINIYLDGVNILNKKIDKMYFNKNNFVINKNKNLNYNLYAVLFYNRIVGNKELNEIRTYFITNKDKNFNSPDINEHHLFNNAEYTLNDPKNNSLKPYDKRYILNGNVMDTYIDTFDNQNYKGKCIEQCNTLCNLFSKKDECQNNCKTVLLSCQNYCEDPANKDSEYCKNINTTDSGIKQNDCPQVYKKDGNYIVNVSPNSKYAIKYNYSGDRSYGKNRDKAKYTYNLNFPDCPIPAELLPGGGKMINDSCPYIINEFNPCNSSFCEGVNWNVNNYKDLNLNKNCKKAVSNYCQMFHDIDDKCSSWKPSNRDNQESIEFRKYFEDPNDYCLPSQFNIEDHPDFNKYIKKDSIPCWGCKLD